MDAGKDAETLTSNPEQWCEDEERRRAYWAVWEMDQFASILKKLPIMTNWTQNKVLLPAEDDRWFETQPQRSCFLDPDLISRPKKLQATKSNSTKAWYIVLNSLVAEAYTCSSQKTNRLSNKSEFTLFDDTEYNRSFSNVFATLFNSIQLCLIVLPPSLRFYGQYLDFGTRTYDRSIIPSVLHLQSSIYNISMMPEIARLIALRTYVFEAYVQKVGKVAEKETHETQEEKSRHGPGSARELEQCFNASDAIFNIVINCNESHYEHVNPYVAHAPWVAATVQLLRQELTEDESEKKLINSKFEILKAIHERFINHWDMSTVPKQNLDDLAVRLKRFTAVSRGLTQEERTANTRTRNPAPLAHPARNDKVPVVHGDKCWQPKDGNEGENMQWNSNLMHGIDSPSPGPGSISNSVGQSTGQNLPQTQYPYQPRLVTEIIPPEATLQQAYPAAPTGLEDPNLALFCDGQKPPDQVMRPSSGLDHYSWDDVGCAQGQVPTVGSGQDWFSTYAEATGELSEYLDEVFSGSFIG